MKNLRETRKEKGMSLIAVERQFGINNVQLFDLETGKHIPGEKLREQLEVYYQEKINFLDVPINTDPRDPPSTWYETERNFRYFIHMVASLPVDEKEVFIDTIIKQLNKLKDENK